MISVTFKYRVWKKCKLAFPSAGWGCWGCVYNNQYQNEYQMVMACGYYTCLIMMQHVPFSPNLYTIASHVLRNDLRDLRAWRTCKLFFPSACWRCRGWVYKPISKWIPNGYGLKLTLYQWTFESFGSFLRWNNESFISNRLKDSRLFWIYSFTNLSKFQTHDQ